MIWDNNARIYTWHKDMDNDADQGQWKSWPIIRKTPAYIYVEFRKEIVRVKKLPLETLGWFYHIKLARRFYTKEGANQ